MYRQHYLEAVEVVLAWDLPDEALTDAINQQIMQTVDFEYEYEYEWEHYQDFPLSPNH